MVQIGWLLAQYAVNNEKYVVDVNLVLHFKFSSYYCTVVCFQEHSNHVIIWL
jgi:hypothetical protein